MCCNKLEIFYWFSIAQSLVNVNSFIVSCFLSSPLSSHSVLVCFSVASTFVGRAVGLVVDARVLTVHVGALNSGKLADGVALRSETRRFECCEAETSGIGIHYGQWHTDSGQLGGYRRQFDWHQSSIPGRMR